jgi:hypothetical protein
MLKSLDSIPSTGRKEGRNEGGREEGRNEGTKERKNEGRLQIIDINYTYHAMEHSNKFLPSN